MDSLYKVANDPFFSFISMYVAGISLHSANSMGRHFFRQRMVL
jgi:hypothetical protein